MIVVSIIGLMSAVLMPVFTRSRAQARRMQCDVKLKALALAIDAFKQENGVYPVALSDLVTKGYLNSSDSLRCPADPRFNGSYADFYTLRAPNDSGELPVITCPFHEELGHGGQARLGRFTTQFATRPAVLTAGNSVSVQSPGKTALAGFAGKALHGGDRITTGGSGTATLTFADGTTAQLGANADITVLQSFLDGQTYGALYTIVRQTAGLATYTVHHGSRFDVTTPAATAGARGTKFQVTVTGPAADQTQLYVFEGTVVFTNRTKSGIAPLLQIVSAAQIFSLPRWLLG